MHLSWITAFLFPISAASVLSFEDTRLFSFIYFYPWNMYFSDECGTHLDVRLYDLMVGHIILNHYVMYNFIINDCNIKLMVVKMTKLL